MSVSFFIDWLNIHQDYPYELPIVGDRGCLWFDPTSDEVLAVTSPAFCHKGSFSTSIQIKVSGNRITIKGNPSRVNRIDNLFGFKTVDECIPVYNQILLSYGLPPLSRCTRAWQTQCDKSGKFSVFSDGAVITELHVTANKSVGEGNEDSYIKAISTLSYRNSIPRLHTNGKTADWLTKTGAGCRLIYPSVYNKAYELALHSLPKIRRMFGESSDQYRYLLDVIDYCRAAGVVRFELKLKSEFLSRERMRFWGLSDFSPLTHVFEDFYHLDNRLQVEAMNLETITETLLNSGVCPNRLSANTTTLYAIQWMHGEIFDLSKSAVKKHRARLRAIGIDIARPCDLTKFSLVNVVSTKTIFTRPLDIPAWYKLPSNDHCLEVVA
jgi:hypothetical protein